MTDFDPLDPTITEVRYQRGGEAHTPSATVTRVVTRTDGTVEQESGLQDARALYSEGAALAMFAGFDGDVDPESGDFVFTAQAVA